MHEAKSHKPEGMLFAEHFIVVVNDIHTVGGEWDEEKRAAMMVLRPMGATENQFTKDTAEKVAAEARESITGMKEPEIKVVRWYEYHAERVAKIDALLESMGMKKDPIKVQERRDGRQRLYMAYCPICQKYLLEDETTDAAEAKAAARHHTGTTAHVTMFASMFEEADDEE